MIGRLLPRLLGAAALLSLVVLALPALSRPEEEKEKPLGDVPTDLKLVPRDATFFVTVHVGDALADPAIKSLISVMDRPPGGQMLGGLALEQVERLTFFFRRAGQDPLHIVRAKKAFDAGEVRKALGTTNELKVHGKTFHAPERGWGQSVWIADDRTFVVGIMQSLVPYLATQEKPSKTHIFADELKLAGKHNAVLAARPSLIYRQIAARQSNWMKKDFGPKKEFRKDDFPRDKEKDGFKEKFGGEPIAFQKEDFPKGGPFKDKDFRPRLPDPSTFKDEPLELKPIEDSEFDGFQGGFLKMLKPIFRCGRVVATADVGEEIKAWMKADFASNADATDGETVAEMALIIAREALGAAFRGPNIDGKEEPFKSLIKTATASLRAAEVKRDGKTVEGLVKGKFDTTALVKWAKEQGPVIQDRNNLRQIGMAFHRHGKGEFMQAICDKDGKPLLSWRVAMLPYIEQEGLYRQFKLDEPWDSPHNKKLLGKMPKIYAPVAGAAAEPDATFYQVVTGENALFSRPDARVAVYRIPDGSSNTILVAEASKGVPWTKPEDIKLPAKGAPKLGGQFKGFFHVVFADGSVRKLKSTIKDESLRAYITPAGRETVRDDD